MLGRDRLTWEGNVKMALKEIGWVDVSWVDVSWVHVSWVHVAQHGEKLRAVVNIVMNFSFP
jgi:hypothetical protein